MLNVREFVLAGVVLQLFLLVGDGVGFAARLLVLMAEAFVERGDFGFGFGHVANLLWNMFEFTKNGSFYATIAGRIRP